MWNSSNAIMHKVQSERRVKGGEGGEREREREYGQLLKNLKNENWMK